MAVTNISLRKLLMILYAPPNVRISRLRDDIRNDLARDAGFSSESGGDFYGPFWADAKGHAIGTVDLVQASRDRIANNARRRNLYPSLAEGFLTWWNERRRWTNEPFRPLPSPRTHFAFPSLDAVVKIDNILAVRDARDEDHFVYPYFSPVPALSQDAARQGLWLITRAFQTYPPQQFRILDVIRGQTFAFDRPPQRGTEEAEFRAAYQALISQQVILRRDYV